MECMKCGREVEAGQVFCESCRAEMDQHPVKADVVIQLPQMRPAERKAPSRRPTRSDQEQLQRLSFWNRMLRWFLLVAMIVNCLLAFGMGLLMQKLDQSQNLGKNYSTIETVETTPISRSIE